MLKIWAKTSETMQHAQVIGLFLGNACMQSLLHACHAAQMLPTTVFTGTNTAHSVYLERFVGV